MDINIIGKNAQINMVDFFAIENDNGMDSINFILERNQGGVDLSDFFGFIVYRNKNGTRTEPLIKTITDDKVILNWTITRMVTSVPGRFEFCITLCESQNIEEIKEGAKMWSTIKNQLMVSEGLTGNDYASTTEPIIVEMMRIAAEVKTYQNNIDDRFNELFNGIFDRANDAANNLAALGLDINSLEVGTTTLETKVAELSTKLDEAMIKLNELITQMTPPITPDPTPTPVEVGA